MFILHILAIFFKLIRVWVILVKDAYMGHQIHQKSPHCPVQVPAIHTAIENPMSAGQSMNASRNFISSESQSLTWEDPSNPMNAFTPILIRITPTCCIPPLALNPLPTAQDFPFPALPAVGVGANLDAGEGRCVDGTFE